MSRNRAFGRFTAGAVGGRSRRAAVASVAREMPRGQAMTAGIRDASTASSLELGVTTETAAMAKRARGSARSTASCSPTPRGVTVATSVVPTLKLAADARLVGAIDQADIAKQARQTR